ncbi:MAG: CYTH domain-containing protein [Candidatus Abawacabacteria bacterium]|nr:CYTH domain-containing protein [Candidatus Abawacabacteria bacterium]
MKVAKIEVEDRYRLTIGQRKKAADILRQRFGDPREMRYVNVLVDTPNLQLRSHGVVLRVRGYQPDMKKVMMFMDEARATTRLSLLRYLLATSPTEATLKLPVIDGGQKRTKREIEDPAEIARQLNLSLNGESDRFAALVTALERANYEIVGGIHTDRKEFTRKSRTGPTTLTIDDSTCMHDPDRVRSILEAERIEQVNQEISQGALRALVRRVEGNNRRWIGMRLNELGAMPLVPGSATLCLWRHLPTDRLQALVRHGELTHKQLKALCATGDLRRQDVARLVETHVITQAQGFELRKEFSRRQS